MQLIECLMKTGLTRNESELYVTLSREGELTGYEAAKLTGIPRANAYQALAGLVDKGGAYLVEGLKQLYIAVPADEYCANIAFHMQETLAVIKRDCPVVRRPTEPYITITGYQHIVDKMKNIINNATKRVYLSVSETELSLLTAELEKAVAKGLKIVAVTVGTAAIAGVAMYRITKPAGQIRLIADSAAVLTGVVTGSPEDTCLYSKNEPLVELIKDSLKNEIKLATLEEKPF